MSDKDTREKIKGLVRQALDSRRPESSPPPKPTETKVEHVRVNSLSPKSENGYERDESAQGFVLFDLQIPQKRINLVIQIRQRLMAEIGVDDR